jgi:inorganic pyrophosphatase
MSSFSTQPGWVDWDTWEGIIRLKGITIERPSRSAHPAYPDIIYPIDYGFVNETMSVDGEEQDIFIGTAENGLVGAIFTTDHRKGDRECKMIFNCSPVEIYLINGFVNFAPDLMSGRLLLRSNMRSMW